MKKLRQRLFSSKVFYMLVSIFFALVLFVTAYSSSGPNRGVTSNETYSATVENVPIDIKYNSDRYFISGYSYEAEVYLTSSNRLKLDSEISSSTRKFKVVADLSDATTGTTTVKLQVKDLPSDVSARISPATMSVTIGRKKTKTFAVQPNIDSAQLANGYVVDKASVSLQNVEVTSDEASIDQIDHVEAVLPSDTTLSGDYNGEATLQAVSASGSVIASAIDPAHADMTVKVKKLTKQVPLHITLSGSKASGVSGVNYTTNTTQVTISGSQTALDAISQVDADIDISDVTRTQTKTVKLSADGVDVDPSSVSVTLQVTK